ncbi:MAG: HEAT repeat domain-containing protein [Anaerolineales bacterium]|nr:HEAT repeat domain-containing protein [Anaerolineales bacterium]
MGFFKPNVSKLVENKDLKGLAKALESRDEGIVRSARDALVRIGEPAAAEMEALLLKGKQKAILPAVDVLSSIAGNSGIQGLKTALRSPDSEVRLQAVRGLGKIATAQAAETILDALNEQDSTIGREMIDVLVRIGRPITQKIEEAATCKIVELSGEKDGKPAVIEGNLERSDIVRIRASAVLANIATAESINALAKALKDRNLNVRFNAVSGLSAIKDQRAAELLFQALTDSAVDVRDLAEKKMGKFDVSLIPESLLRSLLEKEETIIRTWADRLLHKKGTRLGKCANCSTWVYLNDAVFLERQEEPSERDEYYGVQSLLVKTKSCPSCQKPLLDPVTGKPLEERSYVT